LNLAILGYLFHQNTILFQSVRGIIVHRSRKEK
jgi:hypothetical protein